MKKRVLLRVAYDGTNYHGWQVQPGAVTIEQVLNEKLTELLGEPIEVIGASRTDSGVHAMGNVAVFDTEHRMPADKICFALNQRLPEDIRIQSSMEVEPDWHPRKHHCIKTYEYKILNRKMEVPSLRLYTHFCHFDLDLDQMRQAAKLLTGEHDYKSFCNVRTQVLDTVRTVYSIDIEKDSNDVITIRVRETASFIIWSASLQEPLWQWEWARENRRKCRISLQPVTGRRQVQQRLQKV